MLALTVSDVKADSRTFQLPAHSKVTISFDLNLSGTWNGDASPPIGPDRWTARVENGPTLVDQTFHQSQRRHSFKQTIDHTSPQITLVFGSQKTGKSEQYTVSNLRVVPNRPKVTVQGPANTVLDCTPTYKAIVTGGTQPYRHYHWSGSDSNGTIPGVGSQTQQLTATSLGRQWVKCTVYDNAGLSGSGKKYVTVRKEKEVIRSKWTQAGYNPVQYEQCSDSLTATDARLEGEWQFARTVTYTGGVTGTVGFNKFVKGELGGNFSISKATESRVTIGLADPIQIGSTYAAFCRGAYTKGSGQLKHWKCDGTSKTENWTSTRYTHFDYTVKKLR